jgi:predicted ester cyclase
VYRKPAGFATGILESDRSYEMNSENKAVFTRMISEVFNQGQYQVLPELFTPDYIEHQFGLHTTLAGMQSDVEFLRSTFPDLVLTIEELAAVDDKVWARMTARGTNTVGLFGPPNGKKFEIAVFDLCRFENGRIAEHWGSPDRFAQMAQLGLLPKR